MRSLYLPLIFASLCGSLGACSDDSAGGSSSEPAPAAPFTPAAKSKVGALNVFVRPESPGGPSSFYAAGYFLDYSSVSGAIPDGFSRGSSQAGSCTKRSAGSCDIVRCALVHEDGFTLSTPKYVSAGDISVKRASGAELKLSPDVQTTYHASASEDPAPVASGEMVTMTGAGADVAGFSETIAFASAVAPASTKVEVTHGTDAEVAWTGGTTGKIVVGGETGGEAQGFVAVLTCHFDAAAGKGTISGALLTEDLVGSDIGASIDAEPTTKDVGGYEVSFVAETSSALAQNGFILTVK